MSPRPIRRMRRGIYLLPTLFTVGSLFCGFASIVFATRSAFWQAGLLIIIAGVLDGLDGRIARLTGTTSDFGLQFDSMADLTSFGIAPAILAYHWILQPLDRVGWVAAFLFVVCAAMRLARFNLKTGRGDSRFFAGLPSPAAGGMVASVVFAFPAAGTLDSSWVPIVSALFVASMGLLMVSHFRYRSFKEFDLRNRRSYLYALPLAFVLVSIAINPRLSFLSFGGLYVLSAPIFLVWSTLRRGAGALRGGTDAVEPPIAR